MPERNHYPPGIPCWVDTLHPRFRQAILADPQGAVFTVSQPKQEG